MITFRVSMEFSFLFCSRLVHAIIFRHSEQSNNACIEIYFLHEIIMDCIGSEIEFSIPNIMKKIKN